MNATAPIMDARTMRFVESSRNVVGANWVSLQEDKTIGKFSDPPPGWVPLELLATTTDGEWQTVPPARVLRKREKAAERRRAREAGMTVSEIRAFQDAMAEAAWLGRSDAY
jgi:hypothetical protein